jgi:hypothetical protein
MKTIRILALVSLAALLFAASDQLGFAQSAAKPLAAGDPAKNELQNAPLWATGACSQARDLIDDQCICSVGISSPTQRGAAAKLLAAYADAYAEAARTVEVLVRTENEKNQPKAGAAAEPYTEPYTISMAKQITSLPLRAAPVATWENANSQLYLLLSAPHGSPSAPAGGKRNIAAAAEADAVHFAAGPQRSCSAKLKALVIALFMRTAARQGADVKAMLKDYSAGADDKQVANVIKLSVAGQEERAETAVQASGVLKRAQQSTTTGGHTDDTDFLSAAIRVTVRDGGRSLVLDLQDENLTIDGGGDSCEALSALTAALQKSGVGVVTPAAAPDGKGVEVAHVELTP